MSTLRFRTLGCSSLTFLVIGCGASQPAETVCPPGPPGGEPLLVDPGLADGYSYDDPVLAPDGRHVAYILDRRVHVLDPAGVPRRLANEVEAIKLFGFTRDGRRVLVVDTASKFRAIDIHSGDASLLGPRPVGLGRPQLATQSDRVAYAIPSGRTRVVADDGSGGVDVGDPTALSTAPLSLSPDGRYLLTTDLGCNDPDPEIDAVAHRTVFDTATGEALATFQGGAASLLADGPRLLRIRTPKDDALGRSFVSVFPLDPGAEERSLGENVRDVVRSPDGRRLALREIVLDEIGVPTTARRIRLIDLAGGTETLLRTADDDDCRDCAAFSPDSRRLAYRTRQNGIAIRDLVSGHETRAWRDGRWLVGWDEAGLFGGDGWGLYTVQGAEPFPLRLYSGGDLYGAGDVAVFSDDHTKLAAFHPICRFYGSDLRVVTARTPSTLLAQRAGHVMLSPDLSFAAWETWYSFAWDGEKWRWFRKGEQPDDTVTVARTCGTAERRVVTHPSEFHRRWVLANGDAGPRLVWFESPEFEDLALTIVSASGAPGRPWPPSPALPLPDG